METRAGRLRWRAQRFESPMRVYTQPEAARRGTGRAALQGALGLSHRTRETQVRTETPTQACGRASRAPIGGGAIQFRKPPLRLVQSSDPAYSGRARCGLRKRTGPGLREAGPGRLPYLPRWWPGSGQAACPSASAPTSQRQPSHPAQRAALSNLPESRL